MRVVPMIDSDLRTDDAAASRPVDELLRFERLLLELSAGFINLPAERTDEAINDGLRRIVETLGLDRSSLSRATSPPGRVEVVHSFAAEGIEPLPRIPDVGEVYPWTLATLRAGKPVVFGRIDDLPPEATVDKATFRAFGPRSYVAAPMMVAGEFFGALSFGSLRRERHWPADLVARVRLLAGIFANALARKRAQLEIDQALEFERLLADLSASLLRASSLDLDHAIPAALRTIGDSLRIDRVALWWVAPKNEQFTLMHWWSAAGVPPPLAAFHGADAPGLGERLLGGEVVRFADARESPTGAGTNAAIPEALGAGSLLLVPLWVDGEVTAVLSLAEESALRPWPDALVPRVTLFGETLATLLQRDRKARALADARTEAAQFRERLAHLVRVHTAGEMSAALAHEITQPLGAIENYALAARRRIAEQPPDLARVAELVDKLIGQATRAGDVVTRMRGMVQRHELKPEEIDLERAVRDCVEMVKMDCELRGIDIEFTPAGGLPVVVADEIHFQQVVLNLLRNAMEAVETVAPGAARRIDVRTRRDDAGAVLVEVADHGPGIAEGDLERVFESFYSTKPSGLGIGLAICRKLIEAHGGMLWASHNSGGGAVFRFTLPGAVRED